MTDQEPVDPYTLTAQQATEKLAAMTKAYNASKKSDDPISDRYADNKGRVDRLTTSGDPKELARFNELMAKKAEAEPVEAVLSGKLPDVPSSELRQMSELAASLRSIGLHEDIVRESLSASTTPISKQAHDQVQAWQKRATSNAEWVKAYLGGSAEHISQMTAAKIALMHPVEETAV
jgi:hypothetical protein